MMVHLILSIGPVNIINQRYVSSNAPEIWSQNAYFFYFFFFWGGGRGVGGVGLENKSFASFSLYQSISSFILSWGVYNLKYLSLSISGNH